MKRLITCLFLLSSYISILAQNDTTNDSWESIEGRVHTADSVLMQSHLTFSVTDGPRGIRRSNRNYNLDLWGGDYFKRGAAIVLNGDARGGVNNAYNGKLEFFSGGEFLADQISIPGDFDFNTRWAGGEKRLMTLKSSNGRLGIGTLSPSAYLHVQGPFTGYVPGEGGVRVEGNYNTYAGVIINNSGGNNAGGLLIETTDGNGITNALKVVTYRNTPKTVLRVPNTGGGYQSRVLLVEEGGRVGIGTDDPQNALDICGFARAEEIIVQNDWCDFVFNADYRLPSLAEQKEFIKINGHLKNFQSEEEMDGQIHVGDVNKRQQQSIEEIMLYLIKIEERVKFLEEENALLKAKNSKK